jgi:hypothetical protein
MAWRIGEQLEQAANQTVDKKLRRHDRDMLKLVRDAKRLREKVRNSRGRRR